jgi:hypothetical protein
MSSPPPLIYRKTVLATVTQYRAQPKRWRAKVLHSMIAAVGPSHHDAAAVDDNGLPRQKAVRAGQIGHEIAKILVAVGRTPHCLLRKGGRQFLGLVLAPLARHVPTTL